MTIAEVMRQERKELKDLRDLVGPRIQVAPEVREVVEHSLFGVPDSN